MRFLPLSGDLQTFANKNPARATNAETGRTALAGMSGSMLSALSARYPVISSVGGENAHGKKKKSET